MSDKYTLRSRPTLARPITSSEGSVPGQVSGWSGPMSGELDVPMPAQAMVPVVESAPEMVAGVTTGHGVVPGHHRLDGREP